MSIDASSLKALQIVAIQHELAMAIGLDLDLDRMIETFMRTCLRRLALRSIHFYLYPELTEQSQFDSDDSNEHPAPRLSLPRFESCGISSSSLSTFALATVRQKKPLAQESGQSRQWLAYPCDGLGCMILERESNPIDQDVAHALEPIFDRLALSCTACLEHQRTLEEVIARQKAEARIIHQATYDALTGLPNRKTLHSRLRQAVAAAQRHNHYGAIFFIDLDRFKNVNDSLGHGVGDALLTAFAEKLAELARCEDTVARVGGDEFIHVSTELAKSASEAIGPARLVADRIVELGATPIEVGGINLQISVSVGVAIFPSGDHCDEPLNEYCESLIQFADTAMYRAKQEGRGASQFFSPEMQAEASRRHILESNLRGAITNDQLTLQYQPIVAPGGAIIGAEGLLRWEHPELGRVPPNDFIPVAEEVGLITTIGSWVVEEACKTIARLMDLIKDGCLHYLCVNVSPRQIKSKHFVDEVIQSIERHAIPPHCLRLELTESSFVDDIDRTIETMRRLIDYGIQFSLDDFGTGYSSLSHLHRLPVATLKIDRAFITDIEQRSDNQAIVDSDNRYGQAPQRRLYC